MKKVLLFAQHPYGTNGGGIDRYCNQLSSLFNGDDQFEIKYSSLLPKLDLKILGASFNDFELRDEIEKEKPDIIHINGYTTRIVKQIVKLARKYNIKLVYTAHWHPFRTMKMPLLKQLYFNIYIKPNIKYMDAVVTINNEDTKFFKRYTNKVWQIPHWINFNLKIENKKCISRKNNQLLFIGRTSDANKGFEHLLNLPDNKYDIQVVGESIDVNRKDIHFNTNISDDKLTELYLSSSLLLVPSRYEAFSYVSLEALYCGTPILVSDGVKIIDYLPNDSFEVFKYSDYNDFILKVDLAMKLKVSNKALTPFSPSIAIEKYKEMYLSTFSYI